MSPEMRAAVPAALQVHAWGGVLLALVLGFTLALVTVVSPWLGMVAAFALGGLVWLGRYPHGLLLIFLTSLAIPVQSTLAGLPLNAADGLLVLWSLLWPFMMQRDGAPALDRWRVPTVVWAVLPFVFAVLLAQVGSISPIASFKQALRIIEWFVVLPLLLTVFAPDRRFWRFASVAMLLVPCLFAIDGLVETATNGRSLSGMLGIQVPIPAGDLEQIRHTFDISGRAGSTFGGAQGLAMYLVMAISVAIAHWMRSPEAWLRRIAAVSLLICLAGLIATQSRGGALGALAVVLVMALAGRPAMRPVVVTMIVLAGVLGAMALVLWPGWDGSIVSLVPGRPEAVEDRLILWGVAKDVFLEHPFTGVGLGNFRDAFFARETWLNVELGYASVHAHNTYLEILAGAGLAGLVAYLGFLALVLSRLIRLLRSAGGSNPVFTLAAIGTLSAYAVFAMVDMLLLQNMHLLLVLVLVLGLTQRNAPTLGAGANSDMEVTR